MRAWRSSKFFFPVLLLPGSLLAQAVAPNQSDNVAPVRGGQLGTLTYGADIGLGETDNATQVNSGKVSQTIALADVDFNVKEETRRFDFAARGNFTELDYLQHAFSNQVIGRFDGVGQFAIIPERLSWVLQDDWGQAQIDPFTSLTPNNQENVNYVTTGPDLALRLGTLGFIDATARYGRADYQISPFSSNRFIGSVVFGRQLSAQSTVSLDGSTARVLFDNTAVNGDFTRSSAFVHYDVHAARTDFLANLGATTYHQDAITSSTGILILPGVTTVPEGARSQTGPLVKLDLSRKLSPAASLSLDAGRDITDGTVGFSTLPNGTVGAIGKPGAIGTPYAFGAAPAAVISANYTVTYGSLTWQYKRDRTTVSATGRWEKDTYGGQPLLNLTHDSANIVVERRMTRALSAQLLGTYFKSDYANLDFRETDTVIGGALAYRHGPWLVVRLRYDHISRSPFGGITNGTGYDENRVFLTVGYRPFPDDTFANQTSTDQVNEYPSGVPR
ncbi:MAG TPA: hypothetical protein VGD63_03555 [Steroidobacteraceae bacterium]